MNAELVLLGKRVDMSRRVRRRALVIALYTAMAGLIAALWFLTHWRGTGGYVLFAAMLACRLFLGGYYRGGLVKPFQYKRPVEADAAPSLLALKLRVYRPVLQADEDGFRNDEREERQRDHAHYTAYQWLGICVMASWAIASLRIIQPWLVPLGMTPDQFYYGMGLVTVLLFLTLPQSILLWTEPDMEP